MSVGELVAAVGIALDGVAATACLAAVCDCSPGSVCAPGVRVDCLVRAVRHALDGCVGNASPTPTPPPGGLCDPALNGPVGGPPPAGQVVFRLDDESTITLPDGSIEPLRGSLLASGCVSFNTFFAARVEALRFSSDSAAVESGCAAIGRVVASTLYGGDTPVEFSSAVRIGGQLLTLSGRGSFDSRLAALRVNIQLTAGIYEIHLVAVVEDSIVNPGAEVPLCAAWGFV